MERKSQLIVPWYGKKGPPENNGTRMQAPNEKELLSQSTSEQVIELSEVRKSGGDESRRHKTHMF